MVDDTTLKMLDNAISYADAFPLNTRVYREIYGKIMELWNELDNTTRKGLFFPLHTAEAGNYEFILKQNLWNHELVVNIRDEEGLVTHVYDFVADHSGPISMEKYSYKKIMFPYGFYLYTENVHRDLREESQSFNIFDIFI